MVFALSHNTMYVSRSITITLGFLGVYVDTAALQPQAGVRRECFVCAGECRPPALTAAPCASRCATTLRLQPRSSQPNETVILSCTNATHKSSCSLRLKEFGVYEMTCTCNSHLCNTPFSQQLNAELKQFSLSEPRRNKTEDLLATFLQETRYKQFAGENLHKAFQQETSVVRNINMSYVGGKDEIVEQLTGYPKSQALRDLETDLSDDEDTSEGSGAKEVDVLHNPKSFMPSMDTYIPANEAPLTSVSYILTLSFILFI